MTCDGKSRTTAKMCRYSIDFSRGRVALPSLLPTTSAAPATRTYAWLACVAQGVRQTSLCFLFLFHFS